MKFRKSVATFIIGFAWLQNGISLAQVKHCDAPNKINIDLTPELLGNIGFNPQGLVFRYIQMNKIEYEFGEPSKFDVPIDEEGNTAEFDLVAANITTTASISSPRLEFLKRVRENLPTPGKNDSIGVSGGFLQIMNNSTLRMEGNIRYVDNSSKVSWWRQGKSNTPIWLDLKLAINTEETDVSLSPNFQKGPTSVSGPLTKLLDGILLPITAVLKIFNEPTIGEAIDNDIADRVDEQFNERAEWIDQYVKSLFSVASMNNLLSDKALLFSDVYKRRLRYGKGTEFFGKNPKPIVIFNNLRLPPQEDSQVKLILQKKSQTSDFKTHLTPATACQLMKDLLLLSKLRDENSNVAVEDTVTVRKGENLDAVSKKLFRDKSFAMTIAQENGMTSYKRIKEGQELKIPKVSKMIKREIHFVKSGDNLWDLSKKYNVPFEALIKAADSKGFRAGGSLIYPGMLIEIPSQ